MATHELKLDEQAPQEGGVNDMLMATKTLIAHLLPCVGTWMPYELANFRRTLRTMEMQKAIRILEAQRDLCLALVRSNGMFLEFLSPEHRNDREIVRAACLDDGRALKYASKTLRSDRELVLEIVRKSNVSIGEVLHCTPLNRDPEVARTAARLHGHWALSSVPERIRGHRGVARASLQYRYFDAATFGLLPENMQREFSGKRTLMLHAIQKEAANILLASDELLNDRGFVLAAIRTHGGVFGWLLQKKPDITQDLELAEAAVRQDPEQFRYVDAGIKKRLLRKLPAKLRQKIISSHPDRLPLF